MRRLLIAAALALALPAAGESLILPVGVGGLLKADFTLALYACTSAGCVLDDASAVTVTEQANARDYLIAGLPDAEAGSGTWYELTAEPNGVPVRYAWPIQTRTPQSTSAVVSYRVPATVEIRAGDTLPAPELAVAGLAADPTGSTVTFSLWRSNGSLAIDAAAATLVDSDAQADGTWTATFAHAWSGVTTATLADGSYYGRFVVTFSGGGVMTLPPAPGRLVVRVHR